MGVSISYDEAYWSKRVEKRFPELLDEIQKVAKENNHEVDKYRYVWLINKEPIITHCSALRYLNEYRKKQPTQLKLF